MCVVQLSTVGLTHSTNGQKTALFSFAVMYRAQLTGILSYQLFSFPDLTAKVTVYLCYSEFPSADTTFSGASHFSFLSLQPTSKGLTLYFY